jgi:hypothetical protein
MMPEAAAHELQRMVDEIVGYRQRTRWLRWGTTALAVVSLALGVTVGILVIGYGNQASTLSQQQTALHRAQLANCGVANGIRAKETALWHTLFALSAANNSATGMKESPATQKFLAQFLGAVNSTFKQVNCAKAYPGG